MDHTHKKILIKVFNVWVLSFLFFLFFVFCFFVSLFLCFFVFLFLCFFVSLFLCLFVCLFVCLRLKTTDGRNPIGCRSIRGVRSIQIPYQTSCCQCFHVLYLPKDSQKFCPALFIQYIRS